MKLLGYDFITKETLKLFKSKDLIIDDVAVTRKNRKSSLSSLPKFFSVHRSATNVSLGIRSNSESHYSAECLTVRSEGSTNSPKNLKPLALRRDSEPGGMNQVQPLVQRTVIVNKDSDGFGLTVTGDNPVFVQTVKEDGAAFRAGVRQGDRIMRVNGTPVTASNHMDVVRMISCGTYAALTLLGKAPHGESSSYVSYAHNEMPPGVKLRSPCIPVNSRFSVDSDTGSGARSPFPMIGHPMDRKSTITGPSPVDEEKQAEWRKKRVQIISQMLDEEKKHLEELKSEIRKDGDNSKGAQEKADQLVKAEMRIKNLESQLVTETEKDLPHGDTLGVQPPSDGKTCAGGGKTGPLKKWSTVGAAHKGTSSETSEPLFPHPVKASSRTVTEEPLECLGMHFVNPTQVDVDIIPMDDGSDDDLEGETLEILDMQGPFSNLEDLKNSPAHLAVFLHYLISNSDPASLLFYLIADQYQSGSMKDLKRWAYEIHSTFIAPTGPFQVANIDKDMVESIDLILCSSVCEHEDQMKRIFVKAQVIALDDINEHLADFRTKRTLGLGSVFGESMLQGLVAGDKAKELRIADSLLMQHFQGISDFDQLDDRTQALASALATAMKIMGVKPACNLHEKLLEKCPTFVTKDKGAKIIKKIASKRAVQVKGHHFLLSPVFTSTFCYQCSDMIWGVNAQGYFCSNCDVVLHKQCTGTLEDSCYPGTQKGAGPKSFVRAAVKPVKKSASGNQIAILEEDGTDSPPYHGSPPNHGTILEEEPGMSSSLTSDEALLLGEELDKTTDLPASPMGREWGSKSASADSGYFGDHHNPQDKSSLDTKPVGRSQSMRSREEQIRQSKRHFEQQSTRRAKSDVDVDDHSIAMAINGGTGQVDQSVSSSSSSVSRTSLPEEEAQKLLAAADVSGDSDIEMETDIPPLEEILSLDTIKHLKPKEKKRQDVINELFHTERTHVRKLKILHKLFYTPLLVHQILPPDFVKLLFANIDEILELHSTLNTNIKLQRRRELAETNGLYTDIGDLMQGFFDGETGERFHRAAAFHCQHQQYALEALKARQKKDTKLQNFLTETESNPLCQKLQLKDMIPAEMQRLTKYPLLLETVGKYTPEGSEELRKIKKSVDQAKSILNAVNTAKKNSENLRRLEDLQKRLDTSPFDKENHPMSKQLRGMDLRRFSLIHEGPLQWRLGKNKLVDLHVLLLEDLLLLSTRHSDGQKLSLRYYDMNMLPDGKWCPALKLTCLMAKNVATDKKAFFLVSTSAVGPQIYELVAGTATAKRNWFKLITDQVDLCKQKEAENKREASVHGAETEAEPQKNVQDNKLNDSGVSDASQGEDEASPRNSERVQIISQPRLINPSEIEVSQPTVYENAEPVLSDLERVKRQDKIIMNALNEKQKLLVQMFELKGGKEELNKMADAMAEGANRQNVKDSKELVLSSIVQANRLLEAINEGMRLKKQHQSKSLVERAEGGTPGKKKSREELKPPELVKQEGPSVACFRLTGIAAPLMRSLTAMLHSMQQTEEELKRVREELAHYKQLCQAGSLTGSDKSGADTDQFSDLGSSPSSVGSSAANNDFIQRAPRVTVGAASSEETLTDSKVGTPQVKTPDSLSSPNGSSRLSPSRLSIGTESVRSPSSKSPVSPHRRAKSPLIISPTPERSKSPSPSSMGVVGTAKIVVQNPSSLSLSSEELQKHDKQKTPSPASDDDEERKREKRKQKRQRHTALTGLDPGNNGDFARKQSVEEVVTGKLGPVQEMPS